MNPLTTRRRGTAASVVLVSLGLGYAPRADTTPEPPAGERVVTIIDEGDSIDRVLLAAPIASGSAADSTTTTNFAMTVDASGFNLDLDLKSTLIRSIEVLSADLAGGYVAVETITSFEQTASDTDGEPVDAGFAFDDEQFSDFTPLVGTPLVVERDTGHQIVSVEPEPDVVVTVEQEELIDVIAAEGFGFGSIAGLLPDTPVGKGARWMVSAPDSPPGIAVPVELSVMLANVSGSDYTLAIAMAADIADLQEFDAEAAGFDELGGKMTLIGTIDGSLSDGLDFGVAAHIVMDITFVSDGVSAEMHVAVDIAETSTRR